MVQIHGYFARWIPFHRPPKMPKLIMWLITIVCVLKIQRVFQSHLNRYFHQAVCFAYNSLCTTTTSSPQASFRIQYANVAWYAVSGS